MSNRRLAGLLLILSLLVPVSASAARTPRTPRSPVRPSAVPGELVVVLPAGESFVTGPRGEALVRDAARAGLLAAQGLTPARVLGRGDASAASRLDARGTGRALGGRFALLRETLAHPLPKQSRRAFALAESRGNAGFPAKVGAE